MNLCELVVQRCRDVNISTFFGVPGIHNLPIYAALHKLGVTTYTTRHEQSAAFMADGYARATGRVAGCVLIDGPGFLNAATAIGQANADSIPMVVITPCVESDKSGTLHQLPGQARISREICRSHLRMTSEISSESINFHLNNHLRNKRPGVCHIEIPLSLVDSAMQTSTEIVDLPPDQGARIHGLDEAKALLSASQSPLIIAGGGCLTAIDELRQFAESLDAPVVTTTATKGILASDHPLRVGASPSLPEVRALIESADVVVAVGTELGETDFDFFFTEQPLQIQKLIRIDIDPGQLDANVKAHLPILGDARLAMAALLGGIRSSNTGKDRVVQVRDSIQANPFYDRDMDDFLRVIQERTDVLVGDSSQPNYYALWQYEPRQPRSYFHSVTGFGTLGYGIPAAIGAKIGRPEDKVACLIGDGGAGYTLSEVQTAKQFELNIPFIIWNNYGFGEIDKAMRVESSVRYYESPRPPCYRALAEAFGMDYEKPEDLSELDAALSKPYSKNFPTIIEVQESRFVKTGALANWFNTPTTNRC